MWKENLGNYLIDVSKYFLTGVFVTSLINDLEEVRWLIYVLSGAIAGILLVVGLYLLNGQQREDYHDGNIDNLRDGRHTVYYRFNMVSNTQRQTVVEGKVI